MKQIILNLIALILISVTPIVALSGSAIAAPASKPCPATPGDPKTQVLIGIDQTGNNCQDTQVNDTVSAIVKLISYVAGIVAVIMILVSGFKFMTSAGDAGKTASARSTLIYAMIGLAIAALAQAIVQFVLSAATKAGG